MFEYATERDDEYMRVPGEETGARRDLTQSVMLHTQLHHSFSVVGVTLGQEQDVFEYAMSWRQSFKRIYDKYTWLKSFARINTVAVETLVRELTNELFEGDAGATFQTTFTNKISVLQLYNRKQSTRKVRRLIEDFAKVFTGKNTQEALLELNQSRRQIRTKDAVPIAFLTGINLTLIAFQALLLTIPDQRKS